MPLRDAKTHSRGLLCCWPEPNFLHTERADRRTLSSMPTVAIIGAGPAGSSAAIHLARAGIGVILVESRAFPRVKVCGEFISPSATSTLESVLTPAELRAAGAQQIRTFILEWPKGRRFPPPLHPSTHDTASARLLLPSPAWALSRASLDTLLLDRARTAGAHIQQPAAVHRVEYNDSGVTLRLASGLIISADLIIHADGSGRHDPSGPTPVDRRFVAAKCHFKPSSASDPVVRIRSGHGLYAGTIGVEASLGTCALVCRAELLRHHKGDIGSLLDECWRDRGWRAADSWEFCALPRSRPVRPGHPRSFRIGNAAAAVDPIGGEGIGMALWAGRNLAQRLIACDVTSTAALERVQLELHSDYRLRLRTRLPACHLAAACLIRPGILRAAAPLLALPHLTIAPWYRLTGKPRHATPPARAT